MVGADVVKTVLPSGSGGTCLRLLATGVGFFSLSGGSDRLFESDERGKGVVLFTVSCSALGFPIPDVCRRLELFVLRAMGVIREPAIRNPTMKRQTMTFSFEARH